MARHARAAARQWRRTRAVTLVVVWLGGFAAGIVGLLGCAARFTCDAGNPALACGNGGSALGALVVLIAVVVVTAVTLSTADRPPRRVLLIGVLAVVVLAACYLAGRGLLATV